MNQHIYINIIVVSLFNKYRFLFLTLCLVWLIHISLRAGCPVFACPQAERLDSQWHTLSRTNLLQQITLGIQQSRKEKSLACEANWLRRLGLYHAQVGQLKQAADVYLLALQKSEQAGDVVASASNNNQLGVIYYRLKIYPSAVRYFIQSVALFLGCEDYRGVADVAANVAETYLLMDSSAAALPYLHQSLQARKLSGNTNNIGSDYYALAQLFINQQRYDSASYYGNKALSAFHQNNNPSGVIQAFQLLGQQHLRLNQPDSAIGYYQHAFDTANKYQLSGLLEETVNGFYQAYLLKKDTFQTLKYLQLKTALKDTLITQAQQFAFIDAERKYHAQQQEKTLALQEAEINHKNLMIGIGLVLLLLAIITVVLLVLISRNRKKIAQRDAELHEKSINELLQLQEMETVNALLKGQHQERKRIAQDLHDRLGSILATVKLHFTNMEEAIAQLQQQQGKSYLEANVLLDEACEEVRRISHDLYEGSLEKFGFVTALNQLINALEKTNTIQISFIENGALEPALKPFEKDLYRITQELLSNTLKYAEADKVNIQLTYFNQLLTYVYEDNGKGFDKEKINLVKGIGYKNIASRVEAMKGNWHVDTFPAHGMTLVIEIPVT